MRAAQIVAYREPLELVEIADPKIGPRDALVRVLANGICRSDWHTWNGDWGWLNFLPPPPVIPGHEIAGVIEEVGFEVHDLRPGDRVAVPFTEACGHCEACRLGQTMLCWSVNFPGYTHSGGYGELVAVPNAELNAVRLPDEIGTSAAAVLSCRYATAFNAVVIQGRVQAGQWVTIFGTGGMGSAAVQIATAAGARVIAVDLKDDALEFAQRQGAVATINAATEADVPAAVHDLTSGGAHVSVDCITRGATVAQSLAGLRRKGRHVNAGMTDKELSGVTSLPIDLLGALELELVGCSLTPHAQYSKILGLVAAGKLNPESLITAEIDISDVNTSMTALDNFATLGMHVITSF